MATWRPKRIQFSTEDEVFRPFMDFCAAAYPDQSPVSAVREACLVYMGTDPLEAARAAARRAAFLETRIQLNAVLSKLYRLAMLVAERRVNEAEEELAGMIASGQIDRGRAA